MSSFSWLLTWPQKQLISLHGPHNLWLFEAPRLESTLGESFRSIPALMASPSTRSGPRPGLNLRSVGVTAVRASFALWTLWSGGSLSSSSVPQKVPACWSRPGPARGLPLRHSWAEGQDVMGVHTTSGFKMKGCLLEQLSHNNGLAWTLMVKCWAWKHWRSGISISCDKVKSSLMSLKNKHCVYEAHLSRPAIEMWKSEKGPHPLLRSCQWSDGLALLARIVGRWDFLTQVVISFWFLQLFGVHLLHRKCFQR